MDIEQLKYPVGRFDSEDERWNIQKTQAIDYLSDFPNALWQVISPLTDDQMQTQYRPDGWTITQVVHHLSDSHLNAYARFKLSLTETDPVIKPYDENKWVQLPDSTIGMIGSSMNLLKAIHQKWAHLMTNLTDEDWNKRYYHPANEAYVPLSEARKLYHWHSTHHLAHITDLIKRENW